MPDPAPSILVVGSTMIDLIAYTGRTVTIISVVGDPFDDRHRSCC